MAAAESIAVSVVYALPQEQFVVALELPAGSTAGDALRRSGLLERFPGLQGANLELAVFSRFVSADHQLASGDRLEIVRPLKRDPREARRELAAQGRTMGRRSRNGYYPDEPV